MNFYKKIYKNKKAKGFQQLNSEWNNKIKDMKSFKQNQYESRRLNTLGKLEKRENSVMLTKSNINSTFSRLTDSFNTRIEYAKSRMYQQTEVLTKLK